MISVASSSPEGPVDAGSPAGGGSDDDSAAGWDCGWAGTGEWVSAGGGRTGGSAWGGVIGELGEALVDGDDALACCGWGVGVAAGVGATGVPGTAAADATGRSTWRLIDRPQLGQNLSSLEWMAAHRGQAVMPASRSTVTGSRSLSAASSVRSSESMWPSVVSLARTSASFRCPKRCRLNTRPPRSRYASSRALRRNRARRRARPRDPNPGEPPARALAASTACSSSCPTGASVGVVPGI
jgi:hypothetical protein